MTTTPREQLKELLDDYRAAVDAFDGSTEQAEALDAKRTQVEAAKTRVEQVDAASKTAKEAERVLGDPDDPQDNPTGPAATAKGLADAFLGSDHVKQWMDDIRPRLNGKGRIPDSPTVLLPGGLKALFKTPLTGGSNTSAGAMVFPDEQPFVPLPYQRPLVVRDVITNGQTDSDTVTYPRMVSVTKAAAPTAEGDPAPEAGMTFEVVTANVVDIPVYMEATKRALADAGQLRTLIEAFLRYDIQEEVEDQVVQGSGLGQNLEGILNVTGTQVQSYDTDIWTTVRKAKTKAVVTGRAGGLAVLLHPEDDETIELQRDSYDRFYGNGPFGAGPNTIWAMPKVVSEAVPAGTALVGDMRQAVLWDRQQISLAVSDSHGENFTKQIVTILANIRVAFGVLRPAAIVETDLSAASS